MSIGRGTAGRERPGMTADYDEAQVQYAAGALDVGGRQQPAAEAEPEAEAEAGAG